MTALHSLRRLWQSPVLFVAGLFAVGFTLRLATSAALAAEPVWDGHYYDFGARQIAKGFGYADEVIRDGHLRWHPWCHYPVGYSAFLAAFYIVFGTGAFVAHVANAFVGALVAVATYSLAVTALSPARAKIAAILVAIHPGLVLYSALLMTEPLSALLTISAFAASAHLARTQAHAQPHAQSRLSNAFMAIAAGALILGVAALVRPQALLCAPFLAFVIRPSPGATFRHTLGRRTLGAIAACCIAMIPIAPWTARNCRVMDGCALVSTNAGWNLAIGAFPRATGRFETLRATDGCREVTGQVQQDRCWYHFGLAHIKEAPGRWLSLIPKKLSYTFDQESFAIEYLHEARPEAWPESRRAEARTALTTLHRALLAFSLFAWLSPRLPSTTAQTPRGARASKLALLFQVTLTFGTTVAIVVLFRSDDPAFWPVAIASCILPWLPLPGRPETHASLRMAVSLIATTAMAHAIFFGEDRYHIVATPVFCVLAAAAFRRPPPSGALT